MLYNISCKRAETPLVTCTKLCLWVLIFAVLLHKPQACA